MWVVRVLGMTNERGGPSAECKQCSWSATEPTRQAALDAAKAHRQATGGHLVVLRGV
jgi:hypothetical protein